MRLPEPVAICARMFCLCSCAYVSHSSTRPDPILPRGTQAPRPPSQAACHGRTPCACLCAMFARQGSAVVLDACVFVFVLVCSLLGKAERRGAVGEHTAGGRICRDRSTPADNSARLPVGSLSREVAPNGTAQGALSPATPLCKEAGAARWEDAFRAATAGVGELPTCRTPTPRVVAVR